MSRKSLVSMLLGAGAGLVLLSSKQRRAAKAGALAGREPKRESGSESGQEQTADASDKSRDVTESSRQAADDAARRYLMYVIMPVWAGVGFLDWLWHRQTKIETTSGVKESAMHLVMMAEAGVPILTGLFLEMNAGALALMSAGWLLHEATVAWDVSYSLSRRKIYAREQHTHSYMQSIPFDIVTTLACLYPEQARALVGLGPKKADWQLRFRKAPVPLKDFALIVACMGMISGLPHLEELWRCYRAQQRGEAGSEIPECAQELYGS